MDADRTIKNFNERYNDQGGVSMLLALYKQGLSSPDIGKKFNLQGKQIDYYLKRIIGKGYISYPYRKIMADFNVGPRLDNDNL